MVDNLMTSELFETKKENFLKHIQTTDLSQQVKDIFFDQRFFNGNDFPDAYIYYAEMFASAFSHGGHDKIDLLNIAGYLYFRSILCFDKWSDKGVIDKRSIILGNACQEEALRILLDIFQKESLFWEFFKKRKEEFLSAQKIDKDQRRKLTFEIFEDLADFRSTFGKLAIDSLFVLNNGTDNDTYETLLKSHRLFSIGFQIIDDIQDFKADYYIKQKNICHTLLANSLLRRGINYKNVDLPLLHKHLYVHGIVEDLLLKADDYFERAKLLVSGDNFKEKVTLWINLINHKQREAKVFLLQIRAYEKTLVAKKFLSTSLVNSLHNHDAQEAVFLAYDYVASMQNNDGSWDDIYLNAGLSNVWATGFVLFNLPFLQNRDRTVHKLACDFLSKNRQGQLWGYNTNWIPDVDSTTCSLLALMKNGIDISKEVKIWLKLQNCNGGFSTYPNKEDLSASLAERSADMSGWLQAHVCVSALAYYFLSIYNRSSLEFKLLEGYILNNFKKDNRWHPYWWSSPIYSTVYAIKGLLNSKSKDYININKIVKSILDEQNENGSFGDGFTLENSFYTSLILGLLTSNADLFFSFKEYADRACAWLVRNQYSDGSFSESTCLRVPSPQVTNPSSIKEWKIGNKRTNIITTDFCRLFSTTMACNSLYQYNIIKTVNTSNTSFVYR
jgi:hypothetical protein